MLLLKSITLKNFRAIKEGTLTPLDGGITGLSGPNGTGKSAFLDGLLWAMYGVLPTQATQRELRNLTAETREECYVDVVLETDGGTLRVRRKLTGKNATATLDTWRNGEPLTETSVKVGQVEIVKMTNLTQEAFVTTVLVQQKHLDDLVSSAPTPRREMIERLSGINHLSTALKLAREESNTAKVKADAAIGSEEDIELAKADCKHNAEALTSLNAELAVEREKLAGLEVTLSAEEARHGEIVAQVRAFEQAKQSLETAKSQERLVQERVAGLKNLVQSTSQNLPEGSTDDIVSAHKDAHEVLARVQEDQNAEKKRLEQTRSLGMQVRNKIDNAEALVVKYQKDYATMGTQEIELSQITSNPITQDQVDEAETNAETAMQKLAELHAQVLAEQEKKRSLEKSIELLEGEDKQDCPTCQSKIDNPAFLLDSLRTTVATAENTLNEYKVAYQSLEEAIRRLKSTTSAIEQEKRAYDDAVTQVASIREQMIETENQMAQEHTKIKDLATERETHMNTFLALEKVVKEYDQKITNAQRTAFQFDAALENIHEAQKAREKLSEAEQELGNATEMVEQQSAALATVDQPDADTITAVENAVEVAASALREQSDVIRPMEDNLISVTSDMRYAEENLAIAKRNFENKKHLLQDLSSKTASSQVLDEFRKAQIARIAPELSAVSTGLISSMTDGFYVEVTFDENFTPTLLRNDGQVTPLSFLSGGEKSVVALAMRIAISDLISGNQGGLLMLDEVLTAQDQDRRQYLVETLRGLSARQIIMINHTQGANDIVDRSLVLSRDDEGNTFIVEDDNGALLGG